MSIAKEKTCPVCGTSHKRRGKTCSSFCASVLRKTNAGLHKKCQWCGKDFLAFHAADRFCSREHEAICVVCHKIFIIGNIHRPSQTCSPSCASSLSHSPASEEKRRKNSMEKWGVPHPFQNEEFKKKMVSNPKVRETRYGSKGFEEAMEKKYGVRNGFLLPQAVPGRVSQPNLRWKDLLEKATGLTWKLEEPVGGIRSVDLYVERGDKRLAVEINPTATHNSFKHLVACNRSGCTEFPCKKHGKKRSYHQKRALALEEAGIQLISIFDWMEEDRILAFVRGALQLEEHRIGARQTELREISQRDANRFLKTYHLLGGSTRQEYCYGLFFRGELLQVQTFSRRGESWEARRLATKDGWQIMGGVSKGTKRFIEKNEPRELIAFSDLGLSSPTFDLAYNGFSKRELQPPTLCWSKGRQMVLGKTAAFQSADRLLKLSRNSSLSPYPAEWSNEEVFLAEGWLPVWDCGKYKDRWLPVQSRAGAGGIN